MWLLLAFFLVIPQQRGGICCCIFRPSSAVMMNCFGTITYLPSRRRSVKKRTKIILAVALILISYFSYSGIDYYLRQQRITAKERNLRRAARILCKLPKPGMMRADVERELRQRSIPFDSYSVDGSTTDDFVLLEGFNSRHNVLQFRRRNNPIEVRRLKQPPS